jgi:TPR repeat protein
MGAPRAQAYLGMIYWSTSDDRTLDPESNGLEPHLSREQLRAIGRRLIESAATNGSYEARNELGLAHLTGSFGVPKDFARSLNLFTAADAQGDPIAAYNLARMHYAGYGVERSAPRAIQLLWRSAARGYQPALCTLALLRDRAGAGVTARAFRIAARALDQDYFACSFDHSDVSDEFIADRPSAT